MYVYPSERQSLLLLRLVGGNILLNLQLDNTLNAL